MSRLRGISEAGPGWRFRAHPDVVAESAEEELLIVQLVRGTTFRLNGSGRAMWSLLATGLRPAEVAERLHCELGVSTERLKSDVDALVSDLLENTLLDPLPGELR